MKRKTVWALLVVALAAGGGLWLRQREQGQAENDVEVLRTVEVSRDVVEITVASSGYVVLDTRYELFFETPGTVTAVDVEVGDRVQRGQRLAVLDDKNLQDALHQVRLDLAQAELSLEQLQKSPDADQIRLAELAVQESLQAMAVAELSEEAAAARAELNQTRARDFEEVATDAYEAALDALDSRGLPEALAAGASAAAMEAQGNVGITQLRGEYATQQAQSQWRSANERYARASQTLRRLQEGTAADQLRSAELTLAQVALRLEQAEVDLKATVLTAPSSGVIASVMVSVGAPTSTAMPAVVLLDDSVLYVDLSIDELDIGMIQEGQPVRMTLDAYPDRQLDGTVERIGMLPQTTTGSVAYPVRVTLTRTDGVEIRGGMTAGATITTDLVEDALRIPNWAVRTDAESDQFYTYRMVGGLPQRVEIQIGARNEIWTEIVSGIEVGTTVALVAEPRNLPAFQGPPSMGRQ